LKGYGVLLALFERFWRDVGIQNHPAQRMMARPPPVPELAHIGRVRAGASPEIIFDLYRLLGTLPMHVLVIRICYKNTIALQFNLENPFLELAVSQTPSTSASDGTVPAAAYLFHFVAEIHLKAKVSCESFEKRFTLRLLMSSSVQGGRLRHRRPPRS
jgi:hypothetical protein